MGLILCLKISHNLSHLFETNMKKIILLLLLAIISCNKEIDSKNLENLNGYWEIEKATDVDGNTKDYKINETIDYFFVKNNVGFRKKVMPQFDGKYLTNNLQEGIKVINNDDSFFIEYQTDFSSWKDEIIEISLDKLVLRNDQKTTYYYKKHIPFSIK